jgi:hypothetical protein
VSDHLYFIQSDVTGSIKIGRSNNPKRRLGDLQTGNPRKIKLISVIEGKGHLEKKLHESLKDFKLRLEWFDYKCVGSIPAVIYEMIDDPTQFDDWWEK